MAEVFGVAAGALTVIDLSKKVISRCKHIIETTRDAPKDLRHILIEVSSLEATLESLEFLSGTESDVSDMLCAGTELMTTMNQCRQTVEDLASVLENLSVSPCAQPVPGKRQMLKGSLSWCLKESKARKLLEATMQHRATISLALLGDVARDVKDLKRGVKTIHDSLTDAKLREICAWLEPINPTGSQNNAGKLREENTCRWILRHREWQEWLSGTGNAIWIHGIPGAGKTILASFINEQVESHCASEADRSIHVYFYFSYRNSGDQTVAFLGWFLGRLCRQLKHMSPEIQRLHSRSVAPKPSDLIQAIKKALSDLDFVYLVIDAIDECNTRNELLDILSIFLTDKDFAKIRLLATSRDYADIRVRMEPISTCLSMSNPVVSQDILAYAQHEIQTNSKLRGWPLALRTEIAHSLAEEAHGMFRWAACQLTTLQKKRTEPDIRRALKHLPETLDETYLRTLREIPKDDWPYARRALSWICVHEMSRLPKGVPNNCLISAVFSNADSPVLDPNTLHEICGCLISNAVVGFYEDGVEKGFDATTLAHYTVKEFLFSERLSTSELSYFSLSEREASVEYLGTVLQTCAKLDLSKKPDCYYYETFAAYCRKAARIVPYDFERLLVQEEDLWQLQISFLNNPRFPVDHSLEFDEEEVDDGVPVRLLCWDSVPQSRTEQQALVLLSMTEDHLWIMTEKFLNGLDLEDIISTSIALTNAKGDVMHTHLLEAIGIASAYYGSWMVDTVVEIMDRKFPPSTVLMLCMAGHLHGAHCFEGIEDCQIDGRLGNGANPNGPGFQLRPLQLASLRWDYAGVDKLLHAGALPNAIGHRGGKSFAHIDSSKGQWTALHIIRNSDFCLEHVVGLLAEADGQRFVTERYRDRDRIEQLLLRQGAEDFTCD
ncbi:hypothetical protein K458DRAFT_409664 [Lentithecium fluviatile CBS 122367]|uniref:NACHT domain-containing protein n=1 Tax=Lentithecium fluviatile CBS 122367 TaxID=1168545 RepID=A0A6G1IGU1_9PLEO|nr:hypothetical protein K458DRAFT_409664 [Lentithecium fluviatile CBS 122367]